MARRKTRTYGIAVLKEPRGRLPARQFADVYGNGPRFSLRSDRLPPQIISQLLAGLRSEPGGAPARRPKAFFGWAEIVRAMGRRTMPPERLVAQGPRAPHLVPPSQRLARAPLQKDEVDASVSELGRLGITRAYNFHTSPSRGGGAVSPHPPSLRSGTLPVKGRDDYSRGRWGEAKPHPAQARSARLRHPPLEGRDKVELRVGH